MTRNSCSLLTDDESLFARFRKLSDTWAVHRLGAAASIDNLSAGSIVVIDTAARSAPPTGDPRLNKWCGHLAIIIASSEPHDDEGLKYLEQGASGYCHAYAAEATLRQILDVVAGGELWVGRSLMSRLLRGIGGNRGLASGWEIPLTDREREVALKAANGASNLDIAAALGITERTVKAHLTAIFEKLGIADRLQLALKVHGIR